MRVDANQLTRSVATLKTVGLVPDAFSVDDLWTSPAGQVNPIIAYDTEA